MLQEGKGAVVPSPVKVGISGGELRHLARVAESRDQSRAYSTRTDVWGRGLTSDPTLKGLVGELATCKYLNRKLGTSLDVDETERPAGDGQCDVPVFGVRIQVKTRERPGCLLVRRQAEDGRALEIKWHVCVCCTWDGRTDAAGGATVELAGWVSRFALPTDGRFTEARRGEHMNLELPDEQLQPMNRLAQTLENVRDGRTGRC